MKNAKQMNNEQRKILNRIYTQRAEVLARNAKRELDEEVDKFKDEVKKAYAKKKGEKLLKEYEAISKRQENIMEELRKDGYTLKSSYHNDKMELDFNSYQNNNIKEIAEYIAKIDIKKERMDSLQDKITADIYGLEMSFDEMQSYLEKEIKNILK